MIDLALRRRIETVLTDELRSAEFEVIDGDLVEYGQHEWSTSKNIRLDRLAELIIEELARDSK